MLRKLGIIMMSFMVISLTACASYDAPADFLMSGNSHGVLVHSLHPPYDIESQSTLMSLAGSATSWSRQVLSKRSQRLEHSCYKSWCWSVWGPSTVAQSWNAWKRRQRQGTCISLNKKCKFIGINLAFQRLYSVTYYLLGDAPLPLDVKLFLIPEGDHIHEIVRRTSPDKASVEFVFPYPSEGSASVSLQRRRFKALIDALSTVEYEVQHLEYIAGYSSGPTKPDGAAMLKNEANSTCWKFSAELAIAAGGQFQWTGNT